MFADLRRGPVTLALLFLAGGLVVAGPGAPTPWEAAAQERAPAQDGEILFSQVTVSSAEAALRLELTGGEELSVAFRDGRVLVDGTEVGSYTRGGDLEQAWRTLLGQAIALENDALSRLLGEWAPPRGLTGEGARIGELLQNRFRLAVARDEVQAIREAPEALTLPSGDDALRLLEVLVRDPDRLRALAAAARDIPRNGLRIHVGESVEIPADERVESHILVLDGSLELAGRVDGDVFLLGGRVNLGDDARVEGDLRWADATVEGNRRAVRGRIREIAPVADRAEADLREEIRREIQSALAPVTRPDPPTRRVRTRGIAGNLIGGIGGLIQTVVTFGILLGIGLVVLYFFPRNLEVVARTARNAPGRAAAVGLAGLVLAFPTWVLGLLVLVVSIVGIPVALLWIPVFPLALALAAGLGYLAVAGNLGRWASERDIEGMENLDVSRPAVQIGVGLAILLGAFALAYIFQIGGPWFGFFKGLLMALGFVLTVVAGVVGFGAVLLSRGGRDTTFAGLPWEGGPDLDEGSGAHV